MALTRPGRALAEGEREGDADAGAHDVTAGNLEMVEQRQVVGAVAAQLPSGSTLPRELPALRMSSAIEGEARGSAAIGSRRILRHARPRRVRAPAPDARAEEAGRETGSISRAVTS